MSRTSAHRAAAVQLLIECIREDRPFDPECAASLMGAASPAAVALAADYHGVSGWVHERLRTWSLSAGDLGTLLQQRFDDAVHSHLRATWELRSLAAVLDASGVRWVVMKGPAVVELIYPSPGVRPYGDIDVLVDPAAFDVALAALEENGSFVLDRNWAVIRRQRFGELHLRLPNGTLLDLHWNLVNLYRGSMRIATRELLDRAVRVDLGGVIAPTLDGTDTVIHLALHGTLAGGDRLRWMKDVAMAAANRPPDWVALVERAEAWAIAAPVGFMLRRSRAVLGAQVPEWVERRLLSRPYRVLYGIVDRLSPWQRARGRLTTMSLLLTRSMGLGVGGAARWLVARTAAHFDPREPAASSAFTPRGSARDRAAFVADVVNTAEY